MTPAYVVSADINSGINGDTGYGELAVNSDITVSIGSLKTGLFLNDAPYYIDSLTNADIGIELLLDEYKLIDYDNLELLRDIIRRYIQPKNLWRSLIILPKPATLPKS